MSWVGWWMSVIFNTALLGECVREEAANVEWRRRWAALAEFLGSVLGPDYEIVLHDVSGDTPQVLAIVNSQISGRRSGSPLSSLAMDFLNNHVYENRDYQINYRGMSAVGEQLRCSTFFIKDDKGQILGMLCINFMLEKYEKFVSSVTDFMEKSFCFATSHSGEEVLLEVFHSGVEPIYERCIRQMFGGSGLPGRLPQMQKKQLVGLLEEEGVFQIKGAIADVAQRMGISAASVYRYLAELHMEKR